MSLTLQELIKLSFSTPGTEGLSGLPLLVWGPPGAGKTAFIKEVSAEMGLHMETVLLSVREPADVAGLPVIDDNGMHLEPPAWAKRLVAKEEGVLFFDELSCAAPAVQAAALRIVAERVVGELQLPPGIRVIAATNTAEQAAGGWDLAPPLANRFIHCDHHAPKIDAWVNWLIESSDSAERDHQTASNTKASFDPKMWSQNYAKASGAVSAFLIRQPGLLGPNVPDEPSQASRAWSSPRSWELATRAMAGAWCMGVMPIGIVAGAVGDGPAQELHSFLSAMDLPDPRDLLSGKVEFKHNRGRLDRSIAVLNSVAAYTLEEPKYAPAAWTIFGSVLKDAPDIAVPGAKTLTKKGLIDSKEATKALAILQPLLSAVNYG